MLYAENGAMLSVRDQLEWQSAASGIKAAIKEKSPDMADKPLAASFHGKPRISKKLVEVLFKQASSSKMHIKVQRLFAKNTMLRPKKMSVDGKSAASVTITRTLSKLKAAGLDLVLSYLSFIT
ncbi:hypothetical protein OIU74_011492 [Salix koriyanagi]|uniref:Uncharacterized protein n=1 Tax=Salix koriyanagi TaxID=2511006 RepID=A0A9Q0YUK3_9ROSI|nr:hypothetical protein OIU74_011492 [Salix koriyanagi]